MDRVGAMCSLFLETAVYQSSGTRLVDIDILTFLVAITVSFSRFDSSSGNGSHGNTLTERLSSAQSGGLSFPI